MPVEPVPVVICCGDPLAETTREKGREGERRGERERDQVASTEEKRGPKAVPIVVTKGLLLCTEKGEDGDCIKQRQCPCTSS